MASIPEGISWTIQNRADWKEAFNQQLQEQHIHLLIAKVNKSLIVYIPEQQLQKAFLKHVKENEKLSAKIFLEASLPDEGFFFFKLQTSLGRKVLQPLFSFEKSPTIQNVLKL